MIVVIFLVFFKACVCQILPLLPMISAGDIFYEQKGLRFSNDYAWGRCSIWPPQANRDNAYVGQNH
jgi:hypothetical protein